MLSSPADAHLFRALTEAVSLLQHAVRQELQAEGALSYVQFEILARLADADGLLTMTDLADGVVYSRSGLTHQAGLLEKSRAHHPHSKSSRSTGHHRRYHRSGASPSCQRSARPHPGGA